MFVNRNINLLMCHYTNQNIKITTILIPKYSQAIETSQFKIMHIEEANKQITFIAWQKIPTDLNQGERI